MIARLPDRALIAYLEGEVTSSERAEIERQLADSRPAHRRLDEYRELVASLRDQTADAGAVDLVPAIRDAVAAVTPAQPARRRAWLAAAGIAAMLVAVAGGVALRSSDDVDDGEFRARSAGPADDPDRWVRLQIYVVGDDDSPRPLGARVHSGDGFLVGYRRGPDSPLGYLMVLAVAADGQIRWFYPAHTDVAADPRSIRLGAAGHTTETIELPDLIEHELPPGALAIYGLFTSEPLPVSEVEAAIVRLVAAGELDPATPRRLPFAGSGQHIVQTEVVP